MLSRPCRWSVAKLSQVKKQWVLFVGETNK
jgi:hypothetical protein